MKYLICTLLLFIILFSANAQFPKHVKVLNVELNNTTVFSGSLSEGKYVDLRFGMINTINCYTKEQKRFFDGHHVLHAFEVPAETKVLVELITRGDMSIYGYMIDSKSYIVPPYVEHVSKSGCASSCKPYGELDRIMIKSGNIPMNVIVGVAGIDEANKGAFNLKITTRK
ncbi:MAG: hypothetical protein MK207_07645 [Saprospiraceae bacterium]|nr:hypothetical protein [Saprospiraceae bacterium]